MRPLSPSPTSDIEDNFGRHAMNRFIRQLKPLLRWSGSVHRAGDVPAEFLLWLCRTRLWRWAGSVHRAGDVPAALLLWLCYTRPAGITARCMGGIVRRLRIRPR